MNLKDLVGKLAIRTARPDATMDFSWLISPRNSGRFCVGSEPWRTENGCDEQYMDAPVKIVSVKEEQVVVENTKNGSRKLLERKYIDNHWTDYEALLHPEEEEKKKAEEMAKEIRAAAEPLRRFLEKYYDPMVKVTVDEERVVVERGEFQTAFWEDKEEDKE